MDVAKFQKLRIGGSDDTGGNGEAETLIASRRREDEGVDADEFAVDVDERAAAVGAGINGGVGLNVNRAGCPDRAGARRR